MEGFIYKLTSPSGKCYIGQTIDLKKRFSEYKTFHHCENQKKLFNSLKKYGWDSFEKEVLEKMISETKEELKTVLNEREIYYIKLYDSIKSGYNICAGGNQHRLGVKETEEQKQKKRDSWTKERKLIQSEKFKGTANPRLGKTFGRSSMAKYVNQYTLEGKFIKTWESLMSISREIPNYSFKNISKACNGTIKTSYGFIWRFSENNDQSDITVDLTRKKTVRPKGINTKKVYQYSKQNELIREFDSITEASILYNIPTTNISKCCDGKIKTAGGYIWKRLME